MPSSHYFQLNEIVDIIALTNPQKLLDIGIGFGKFGFLAREYLELWNEEKEYHDWNRQIDGIEAFEPYITPVHRYIYNNIFTGNAIEILPCLKDKYDLILLIDVLEHFKCEDGLKLMEQCRKTARNILVSVPLTLSEQGTVYGNPFETHYCAWKKKDFDFVQEKFFVKNPKSLICFIGDDSMEIKKILKKRYFRQSIKDLLELLHMKPVIKFFQKWV